MFMRGPITSCAAVALVLAIAAPAPLGADVKAGVELWTAGEYRRAVEEWRPLAVAGDADAQFNLGQAYKLGRGVPDDPALAESWFRRAALQGHAQAEDNYGLALFQAGRKADAVPWLERSVARGEPRGQLVLGTMLFNGDAVARDHPRAYALMTRASAADLGSASETLAQMDAYITPVDRRRGLELARTFEAQARVAPATADRAVVRVGGPARTRSAIRPVAARAPAPPSPTTPRPTPASHAAPTPRTVAPTAVRAVPAPRAAAGYRVQLGAFQDAGNARALWSRVGARVGGQASYPRAGGVTRLQAGPFRTRAGAVRACAAARTPCMISKI